MSFSFLVVCALIALLPPPSTFAQDGDIDNLAVAIKHHKGGNHLLVRRGAAKCPKLTIQVCIDRENAHCADPDSERCATCLFWMAKDEMTEQACRDYARQYNARGIKYSKWQ